MIIKEKDMKRILVSDSMAPEVDVKTGLKLEEL